MSVGGGWDRAVEGSALATKAGNSYLKAENSSLSCLKAENSSLSSVMEVWKVFSEVWFLFFCETYVGMIL